MRFNPPLALLTIALTSMVACSAQATTLECRQLPSLFESFGRNHYKKKGVDKELQQRTAEKFVDELDASRTMLLEKEVAALKADVAQVFDTMRSGDCSAISDAYKIIVKRAEEDKKVAEAMLGPNYKIDETVELITDQEKRAYAKTPEERAEITKKWIHFQMVNYQLAGLTMDAAKKQLVHRYELVIKRLKEREQKGQLPTMFAEVYANTLDPHSSYMSTETLQEFQIQMRLSLEGIGAALRSEDGMTVIETLVPGGQAEKSNALQPKDKIIAVAQDGEKPVSTIDMDLKDVVKMIRGKKGTKVTLTILRDSPSKRFDITIVRDKVDVAEQAAKIEYETRKVGDKTYKIGVIDLPSFYGGGGEEGGRSSYADMKKLIGEAKKEKVDGLVVDLSRNGGGLLDDAVKIAGLFIRKGGIVATKSTQGSVEVLADEDDDTQYNGPLVLMTSPASASASEILAGALRDYRRAVVAGGEHTFGKGTVQVLLPLPGELGAMKVTTGMFFLPGGVSTQRIGVAAHIKVPSPLDGIDVGEASLDYSLAPESVEPFLASTINANDPASRWRPLDEGLIRKLGEKSAERVAKDATLIEIKKELEEAKKTEGVVKVSELLKKGKDKPDEKDAKGKTKFDRYHDASVSEGVNIALDLITAGPVTALTQQQQGINK
jgi:carboxyl-terminal processing protease